MASDSPPFGGSSPEPQIRKTHNINLNEEEEAILRDIFRDYSRVAIETEFGRGFSGSRVFRVRPTGTEGKAYLPAVVKIAPIYLINKEWQAYETWVKDTLPKVSQIKMVSHLPDKTSLGGLHYSLAGGDGFEALSLADYYYETDIENLCWVLENRLFKVLGQNWWLNHHLDYSYQMQTNYDAWLPVNLKLRLLQSPPDDVDLTPLDINNIPPPVLNSGDQVVLKEFIITDVKPRRREVTLNLAQSLERQNNSSYRVRLVDVPDIINYRVGNVVTSIYGRVMDTRDNLLVDLAKEILEPNIDLSQKQLPLSKNLDLPNPLLSYNNFLWKFNTVYVSTVHGDLNLENIMVDVQIREIELIDFATANQGHALSDLLRLETEVVVMLIPPVLNEANLPIETIYTIYEKLHQVGLADQAQSAVLLDPALEKPFEMLHTIRKMARQCLFKRDDWGEYYQGLTLYLLGALKFKNLSQISKQVAFWTAATIQHLPEITLPPKKAKRKKSPSKPIPLPKHTQFFIEPPFGTMHPDSPFYIERKADSFCQMQLGQDSSYEVTLFIQAPRQMGKSSLMRRTINLAHTQHGKESVFIDFQKFPAHHFKNQDEFLKSLCLMIGDALDIPQAIDRYWSGGQTNIVKCSRYLSDHIMPHLENSLILAMDEVERLMISPFSSDFFAMLRTWHNERYFDENLARISLFLTSSTDPLLLIDNPNQSPFNVAETIALQDFTQHEVEELNLRHESPLSLAQIRDVMDLVGGHPFLIRLALYLLAIGKFDLGTLLAQATEDNGPFGDHLRHYHRRTINQPEMRQALTMILHNQTYEENDIFYRLNDAGLIKRVAGKFVFRNKLYTRFFEERLHVTTG